MPNTFKICRCCRTKAGLRKRVCPVCKVPAIWDRPTQEQIAAHEANQHIRQETIDWLLSQHEEMETV